MVKDRSNIEEFNKSDFLIKLGLQIKKIRIEKGISSAELGRKALMERSHIARLETGGTNPTSTTLQIICFALEIELEDLFKGFKF
jgi:transcriptional regulator with XRE-family HTH domain